MEASDAAQWLSSADNCRFVLSFPLDIVRVEVLLSAQVAIVHWGLTPATLHRS